MTQTARILAGSLLLGAATVATLPAPAQVTGDGPAVLDEIIVTAQKRAQNLQEVPASIAVVPAACCSTAPCS